jgi:hypothetical protein
MKVADITTQTRGEEEEDPTTFDLQSGRRERKNHLARHLQKC